MRRVLRRLTAQPGAALLLAAVAMYALTLRGPIVALAPVIDDVRRSLGIGAASAGLLTGLPVACFAVAAPFASILLAKAGIERAISASLLAILVGTLVRSAGGFAAALAGTLIIGAAITVGNVAVPVVIGRDFAADAGMATAMYAASLNIGAMITSVLTAPLAGLIGWRAALILWGAVAAAALAVWGRAARGIRQRAADGGAGRPGSAGLAAPASIAGPAPVAGAAGGADALPALWRRPFVWGLTLAFGSQAFSYYGVTAWLPTLLHDQIGLGRSAAGASASIFQVMAVVGAFGVPTLLSRGRSPSSVLLIVCGLWITLPLGLLAAPSAWPLWCALGGIAQGGGFTAIFTVVVHRAQGQQDGRRISATVQGGGYAIAATGPFAVGAVHDATGGWSAPLIMVAAMLVLMAAAGAAACRRPRAA